MKQTAIEYLIGQLLPKALTAEQYYHIKQAKELEKQQHRHSWDKAIESVRGTSLPEFDNFEDYFNETYKP